ncbi:MAG TPA: response regulator [Candidatus Nitrosocosmicus sp.]|jgi:two-component system response regulator ChvI|nr:response regulator [Candidatus Nitrosocosmicus sp.]
MLSCSVDSDDLEEDDLVWHHHYIAGKDYDRTIMRRLNSFRNLDLTQSIQQHQLEEIDKNSLKNKRIMLIDDEADILWLFKMILESDARLKVDSFADPLVALENFRPGLYDLLLIDIAMPKMNGFELYDKIRELDKKVKISFVTASEMYYEEIRKETFPELDTNCFIRKPIANEDLIQRVRKVLKIQ